MSDLIARARVLAATFVTYAVIANVAITGALLGIEPYADTPWVGDIIQWGGVAASALVTAVAIVRNVTQVPADLKGLLLPKEPDFYDGVDDFEAFWEEGA